MTLYASRKSAEVMLLRRIHGLGPNVNASQGNESYPLIMIAKDHGADLKPLEIWALRIADIEGPLIVPAIVSFFLLRLVVALSVPLSRSKLDKD